jgi:protein SCO1/2
MFAVGICSLALVCSGQGPSRLAVIGPMPAFSLTTQEGKRLGDRDVKGKVLLVSFIFTTCNGTCPATTHRMSQIHDELKRRGLLKDGAAHFVSITLDPARDTPDALQRYMQLYDLNAADWSFLTGSVDQVQRVLSAWGMWARPAANGQLDHPSRIFLVDRQGRIREIYNLGFLKLAWVAEDVQLLLGSEEPTAAAAGGR